MATLRPPLEKVESKTSLSGVSARIDAHVQAMEDNFMSSHHCSAYPSSANPLLTFQFDVAAILQHLPTSERKIITE